MSRHTLTTYRALADPIKNEGPWDLTGNPNKPFYNGRQGQKILLIGIHITAGIDDYTGADTSAESTNSWGKTATGASWHVCIDSDSIHPSLPDHYVAWVQGVKGYNFNRPGLGIEIGKRTTDWRKAPPLWVEKTLRNVAAWVAPRVITYDIPIRYMTNRDEIQRLIVAGKPVGFAEHWTLTPETRSDAGRVGSVTTFPWAQFLGYVREEVARRRTPEAPAPTPTSEEDELMALTVKNPVTGKQWPAASALWSIWHYAIAARDTAIEAREIAAAVADKQLSEADLDRIASRVAAALKEQPADAPVPTESGDGYTSGVSKDD